MASTDSQFSGSVPEFYDTYMVPLIFEQYAADMARRVAELAPKTVLETAAGSGVVTRTLAPLLRRDATYCVTDLNQPMLDHAAKRQGPDGRMTWLQADALNLPLEDQSFDVVCCQFGAMFFPDRVAGYREAERVLEPGGHFIFNVWDQISENVFADVITKTAASFFPNDPPMFLARTPHGYHDTRLIRQELEKAGFADIAIATIAGMSTAPSAKHVAIAYCKGTPLRFEIEARNAALLDEVTDRSATAIAEQFGQGSVSGKIQAHVIVATAGRE